MLNNGLFFSLIISSLSTGIIYLLTNRKEYTNVSNYNNREFDMKLRCRRTFIQLHR